MRFGKRSTTSLGVQRYLDVENARALWHNGLMTDQEYTTALSSMGLTMETLSQQSLRWWSRGCRMLRSWLWRCRSRNG
jgi:hypothetical protein